MSNLTWFEAVFCREKWILWRALRVQSHSSQGLFTAFPPSGRPILNRWGCWSGARARSKQPAPTPASPGEVSTASLFQGGPHEEQGQSDQADEWNSQWDQSAKALRLGAGIQRQGVGHPAGRAEGAEEICLPGRRRDLHLGLHPFPGEWSRISPGPRSQTFYLTRRLSHHRCLNIFRKSLFSTVFSNHSF